MENINITEKEIIDYKLGNKSSILNIAITYEMPYIVEKESRISTETEKTLMAAELLSKHNDNETVYFLNSIIHSTESANILILGVSLLDIAKNIENEAAIQYLKRWGTVERGTQEDTFKVINMFNDEQKLGQDNIFINQLKRHKK